MSGAPNTSENYVFPVALQKYGLLIFRDASTVYFLHQKMLIINSLKRGSFAFKISTFGRLKESRAYSSLYGETDRIVWNIFLLVKGLHTQSQSSYQSIIRIQNK
jgi:meiotically up-regulated gene 157 (Mug157) protein